MIIWKKTPKWMNLNKPSVAMADSLDGTGVGDIWLQPGSDAEEMCSIINAFTQLKHNTAIKGHRNGVWM